MHWGSNKFHDLLKLEPLNMLNDEIILLPFDTPISDTQYVLDTPS